MLKKVNRYINLSIVLSALFGILGFVFIFWPKTSLDVLAYLIGAFLIGYGIYNFIDSFTVNPIFCLVEMTSSVLAFLLGVTVFLNLNIFESLLPIILGIFFIINGAFKTRVSFLLREVNNRFTVSIITSILMILCGIVIIIEPLNSAIMITSVVGVLILIYAISDIIDMIVYKGRINDICKYFEKFLK